MENSSLNLATIVIDYKTTISQECESTNESNQFKAIDN
jgi:hypothetical protein